MASTKETIKRKTIEDMKKLGVYKPQYNRIIDVFSELVRQYQILTADYEKSGYKCEVKTADGGSKKSPISATLETLRKDILAYSDRLCLNPKSMETMTPEKADKSSLASILKELK